jgi:hypothetical protein
MSASSVSTGRCHDATITTPLTVAAETPEPGPASDPAEPDDDHTSGRRLTANDVRTHATLGWLSIPVLALVDLRLMWLPAAVLFLLLRERDQAGLLRRHLARATSFSAAVTVYALVLRYVLDASGVHGRWTALFPVLVASAAAYPCLQGTRAARRLEEYAPPRPLDWIPLERD